MLEQLVNEIRAGGTLETGDLATRLGTTPQMIEAMLEHLRRNGLVQSYSDCGEGCQGCSLQKTCGKQGSQGIRIWQSNPES